MPIDEAAKQSTTSCCTEVCYGGIISVPIEDLLMPSRCIALLKDHELQHQRRSAMQTRMENKIADPRLRELLIPQFAAGCRRVTPEEGFLEALQAPKTEVINTPLASFVPEGLKLASGEVRPAEVIICATGFDVSWKPPFPSKLQLYLRTWD